MNYRVILDYGDIEVMIIHKSDLINESEILEEVYSSLSMRRFELPPEESIITIEKAPEWEEVN